jgi:hypothetical protein
MVGQYFILHVLGIKGGRSTLDLAAGLTDLASGKLLEAFARNETYLETKQT